MRPQSLTALSTERFVPPGVMMTAQAPSRRKSVAQERGARLGEGERALGEGEGEAEVEDEPEGTPLP